MEVLLHNMSYHTQHHKYMGMGRKMRFEVQSHKTLGEILSSCRGNKTGSRRLGSHQCIVKTEALSLLEIYLLLQLSFVTYKTFFKKVVSGPGVKVSNCFSSVKVEETFACFLVSFISFPFNYFFCHFKVIQDTKKAILIPFLSLSSVLVLTPSFFTAPIPQNSTHQSYLLY